MPSRDASMDLPVVAECIDCGSTEGPDRRERWECGETDLDTWDICEFCRHFLCDSCSEAGNHICYRIL